MWYSIETSQQTTQVKKSLPQCAKYFSLKGHSIQQVLTLRAPSHFHYFPFFIYPLLSDIYRYDSRNATVCCYMLPLPLKYCSESGPLLLLHYNFASEAYPPGSRLILPFFISQPSNTSSTSVMPRSSKGLQQQWHQDDWKRSTNRWKAFWKHCGKSPGNSHSQRHVKELSATLKI